MAPAEAAKGPEEGKDWEAEGEAESRRPQVKVFLGGAGRSPGLRHRVPQAGLALGTSVRGRGQEEKLGWIEGEVSSRPLARMEQPRLGNRRFVLGLRGEQRQGKTPELLAP